ncbi:hypothetical protein J5N97_029818 [Dioscorea zingiberensis]|uniref:Aminotransferase-like plant mobile domain-containing protein n=1 Tax=Dioscorea zingiberensis TaxID=325984 RepID=A0A9D5BWM9_9LILI|nr:hypothetical protein J5N97_029818 [Dioscorea zingiberensis]
MANQSQNEPFWDIGQDLNEVPSGLAFNRHNLVFSPKSEPATRYEGEEHSNWVKQSSTYVATGRLTLKCCREDGSIHAAYLKPEGDIKDLTIFQPLGHKIVNYHPGWKGRSPVQSESINSSRYADWARFIVKNYSKELSYVELIGGIISSVDCYDLDPNFYKALVELWYPDTNTFHLLYGEVGISLWDIKRLGGLPINGNIYDEVIPSNAILRQRGTSEFSLLKSLFDVFQWLARQRSSSHHKDVSFEDWIEFFRKLRRAEFDSQHNSRSDRPPKLFPATDLAAFVALWICYFIMPNGRNVIRPGVFLMASNIVLGRKIAFAPAILARIYIGLNAMVKHQKGPGFSTTVFPSHFLYAWAGSHFRRIHLRRPIDEDTSTIPGLSRIPEMLHYMNVSPTPFNRSSEVSLFIRKEENFTWRPFPYLYRNDEIVRDSMLLVGPEVLDSYTMEYVKCLRCGVLPLRYAGNFHAEPYNPHRFGRQFGYDQHFPKHINVPRKAPSLGVLTGYWLHFSRERTSNSFYIPDHDRSGKLILLYAQKWFKNIKFYLIRMLQR